MTYVVFFFFSSRRRHTRSLCDWSSEVCSSDLRFGGVEMQAVVIAPIQSQGRLIGIIEAINPIAQSFDPDALLVMTGIGGLAGSTIQNAQLFERLQAAHQRYRELFEDSIDPMLI